MPRSNRSAASLREGSVESARDAALKAKSTQKATLERRSGRISGMGSLGKGRGFVRSRAAGYPTGRALRKCLGVVVDGDHRRAAAGRPRELEDRARPGSRWTKRER